MYRFKRSLTACNPHSHGRRNFMTSAVAGAGLALMPAWARQELPRVLHARTATAALVGETNPRTAVWGYEGLVPGPELRFKQGDRLRVELENLLPAATTIHWHGIRLPNAMDGVPHLTQPPVAANGGRFIYEFALPDAGTYWYHPHLGSPEQVGRGLYGALIIEEHEPPAVDRDIVWMLGDWRLDRSASIVEDFGDRMDASHAGRIGNTVTVNGAIRETFELRAGERVRLRLINASNARIYGLEFRGHEPLIVALDGHPVEPHRPDGARVVLGPAMRVDLLLDATGEPGSSHAVVDDFYPRRAYRLLDLRYGATRLHGGRGWLAGTRPLQCRSWHRIRSLSRTLQAPSATSSSSAAA
jgi:FtsP/CotA-like multicopper oxidase with cupredoxin domain